MKKINFTHPISLQKQQEMRIWLLISIIISTILFIMLVGLSYQQRKTLQMLRHEKSKLNQSLVKATTVQATVLKMNQDITILQKQRAYFDHYTKRLTQSIERLKTIQTACSSPHSNLETIQFHKKAIMLMFGCADSHQAFAITHALHASKLFNNIRITALTAQAQSTDKSKSFIGTIQGIIPTDNNSVA